MTTKDQIKLNPVVPIIAGVMLLLAIPSGLWPYGYYQLLRWAVTAVAIYIAYVASKNDKSNWLWAMIVLAIVFNPLWPIYLSKGTWAILDLVAATLFFVSAKKIKTHHHVANA